MTKRRPYLDLLRIVAAFLVIVNHTNSELFKYSTPADSLWWLSIVWFFVCKMAIPLFVMISGALLLGREESYEELFKNRILRIVIVLILVSIPMFILDGDGTVGGFFVGLFTGGISMPLWYLYMYTALLLALPVLRKFIRLAKPKDLAYFLIVWAVFVCLLPVLPAVGGPTVSKYLDPPAVFAEWVGFMVLGYALDQAPVGFFRKSWNGLAAWVCLILPIAAAALITAHFRAVDPEDYLRIERASLITTALPAAALFVLVRRFFGDDRSPKGRPAKFLAELGGTAFGVYLLHIFLIRWSHPAYVSVASVLGRFGGMLVYELGIFAVCAAVIWLVRRIPFVKKFI